MTVDDVLKLQSIDQVVPSPNGKWLAVVVKRSGGPPDESPIDADVWLVPTYGDPPLNITASAGKQLRWSNPVWSPDGSRLALVSRTTTGSVRPYIWMTRIRSLRPLIDRDLDLHATFDRSWPSTPIMWLDSVTVLGAFWERGANPNSLWGSIANTERVVKEGWAKTEAGVEPAVSVLESGRDIPVTELPQGELLRIDVKAGTSRVIANGYFWQIVLDPTKRRAALIVDGGRVSPTAGRRLRYLHHFFASIRHTRLAIARLDSIAATEWVESIRDPRIPEDGEPHNWSPDGTTLAVVAKSDSTEAYGTTAYLVSAQGHAVRQISDRTLAVASTAWSGNGTVLAYAQSTAFAAPVVDTSRYDWWRFDAHDPGAGTDMTSGLRDVPTELQATLDTSELLGLADGRLILITPGDERATHDRIRVDSSQFAGLTWLWPSRAAGGTPRDALFAESANGDCYAIALSDNSTPPTPRLLPRPSPAAKLAAVSPSHHLMAFIDVGRTGTVLSVRDSAAARFETRIAVNQHVRDIAEPRRLVINYAGADGDSLKALIVLPVGYVEGRRYPLVTWVYGGDMIQDTSFFLLEKQSTSALNLNVIPAHGYALLVPSVPVSPEGEPGDPMLDVPKGVLPAVDAAIRAGYADPARVGVMGHSFGGYATYSLITATHRFRAAVALAGVDDLASLYGEMDPGKRYSDYGYEVQHVRGLFEAGQLRMGASPWDNLWRYLRNSPYYLADRVQTPLMIIQGDLDGVGLEQGEEFFSALYRMGKPAKFVRYWGESHVIERSPANVRDMWQRIFDWFDVQFAVEQHSAQARER